MKARFQVKSFEERAKDKMLEAMDAQKFYIMYRTIGMVALAAHESHGVGAGRFNDMLHQLDVESMEQMEWEKEEVGLYMLLKNLRRKKFNNIADLIEESKNEAVEKIRSFGLDWDGE